MCVHLYVYVRGVECFVTRLVRSPCARQRERERRTRPHFFISSVRVLRRPFCRDRLNMRRSFSPLAPACNPISARRGTIVAPRRSFVLSSFSLSPRTGERPLPRRRAQLEVAALVLADYSSNGGRDRRSAVVPSATGGPRKLKINPIRSRTRVRRLDRGSRTARDRAV